MTRGRRLGLVPFKMYTAPWDRWFRTFLCAGERAYELQIGPWVVMGFYRGSQRNQRFTVWRDSMWRR